VTNKKRSLTRHTGTHHVPRGFAIQLEEGGQVRLSLDVSQLPTPDRSFSADAVLVQYSSSHRYVYVYFIAGNPSTTKPRSFVRVRFPLSAMQQQAGLDDEFFRRIDEFVESMGRPTTWTPSLAELDEVPQSSIAALEGTVMSLTQYGEACVCDIYAIPADFIVKLQRKLSWDVDSSLRITLPSLVIHGLLEQLNAIVRREKES